jgi:hypothetical protein
MARASVAASASSPRVSCQGWFASLLSGSMRCSASRHGPFAVWLPGAFTLDCTWRVWTCASANASPRWACHEPCQPQTQLATNPSSLWATDARCRAAARQASGRRKGEVNAITEARDLVARRLPAVAVVFRTKDYGKPETAVDRWLDGQPSRPRSRSRPIRSGQPSARLHAPALDVETQRGSAHNLKPARLSRSCPVAGRTEIQVPASRLPAVRPRLVKRKRLD